MIHPTGLYTDMYELTMAQGLYYKKRHNDHAVFDYFFRRHPYNGQYVVFSGTDTLLDYLAGFSFDKESINYLRKNGFGDEFLKWLGSFKPDIQIEAPEEGTIVFSREPVVKVSGSLAGCMLLETLILNCLNFESLIATKASRIRTAAGDKTMLIDFGLRRAQGFAGLTASKAAITGGFNSSSNVQSGMNFDHAISGTMAHSWVQSFGSELEAFRTYANRYPDNVILLIDTYDTLKSGLPNAITVANELREKGHELSGIRLDSGNLKELALQVRKEFDRAGFPNVKIAVSGDLDEYGIEKLMSGNTPVDVIGVGTRLVTGWEQPALDGVYKLAEINGRPVMKFSESPDKETLPGSKFVFRQELNSKFKQDLISLDHENPDKSFKPLRSIIFKSGKRLAPAVPIAEKASVLKQNKSKLPAELFRLGRYEDEVYGVTISKKLLTLRDEIRNKFTNTQ